MEQSFFETLSATCLNIKQNSEQLHTHRPLNPADFRR